MLKIKKKNAFGILSFCFLIILFLFYSVTVFLNNPPVWPDEAIYTDIATNFLKNGTMSTDLFANTVPGLNHKSMWYPPLYFYLLAFWCRFFGVSIVSVRALSLVFAILSSAVFYLLVKKFFKSSYMGLFGLLLLLIDGNFLQIGHLARMDIITFFFMISGLYLYLTYRTSGKNRHLLASGLFLGLGFITHNIAIVAVIAVSVFILLQKTDFKSKSYDLLIIFSAILPSLLFWAYYIQTDWQLFIRQMSLQFEYKNRIGFWMFDTINSFLTWKIIAAGHIVLLVLLFVRRFSKKDHKALMILTGALIFDAGLIIGKNMWYVIYLQPFLILSYLYLLKTVSGWQKSLTLVFLAFWVFINLYWGVSSLAIQRRTAFNYFGYCGEIQKLIPPGTSVFLSVIPDPYFCLAEKNYKLYEFTTVPYKHADYINLLNKTDYVVINYLNDPIVSNYINRNVEKIEKISDMGYFISIVRLTARDRRK